MSTIIEQDKEEQTGLLFAPPLDGIVASHDQSCLCAFGSFLWTLLSAPASTPIRRSCLKSSKTCSVPNHRAVRFSPDVKKHDYLSASNLLFLNLFLRCLTTPVFNSMEECDLFLKNEAEKAGLGSYRPYFGDLEALLNDMQVRLQEAVDVDPLGRVFILPGGGGKGNVQIHRGALEHIAYQKVVFENIRYYMLEPCS